MMKLLLFGFLFSTSFLWFTEAVTTKCNAHGKRNEVLSQCGNHECQNSCRHPNRATTCSPLTCLAGCVCAPGFLRNTLDDCVRPENCDEIGEIFQLPTTCFGANEVFSTCGNNNCQRSCFRLDVTGCIPFCGVPACVCREGFVRNVIGACVLPSTCPVNTNTCPGQNQVFSNCGNNGCQRSCTRLDVSTCNPVCSTPGCVCASGFVRDVNGACIQQAACPSTTCSKANEVFSVCGNNGCQRSCNRLDVTSCIPVCGAPGCVCNVGFVRNSAGFCVIQAACPPQTCTAANQVFSFCGDDGCQKSCIRLDVSTCNSVCGPPACVCAAGFVKNVAGACVAPLTCPGATTCTGANQVFSSCGNDGCQSTCAMAAPVPCTSVCTTPGCICMPGFVKNVAGDCILPTTCPPPTCTGVNEVASVCGEDGCQRSCTVLTVAPTCTAVCTRPACLCAAGFVRNSARICVLPIQCPPLPCTGANEIFSFCGNDGCQRTCSRTDITTCMPTCGAPACICADGFVKNAAGACVDPATCPPMCMGANEVFSACGDNGCQRTCQRTDISDCVPNCPAPGCICDTGFVKDAAGNCVLLSACPTTCPVNEVFSTCGNTVCLATCTQAAVVPCTSPCSPGCICGTGLLRNSAGVCVAMANCMDCGTGERFRTCGLGECDSTCAMPTAGTDPMCSSLGTCTARCFCRPGWARNAAGVCVNGNPCL